MKEPSSSALALGLAIEATATKTKFVACLESVVKRGLRVTVLRGLYGFENNWLVNMRFISKLQGSRTPEHTIFCSLKMSDSFPQSGSFPQ